MKLNKIQKVVLIILTCFMFVAVGLMTFDYISRPPMDKQNAIYKVTGNIEGSLLKYSLIILIEYIIMASYIFHIIKINRILRSMFVIIMLPLTFLAHINTMEAGGVEAAHALWVTVLLILSIAIIFMQYKKQSFTK